MRRGGWKFALLGLLLLGLLLLGLPGLSGRAQTVEPALLQVAGGKPGSGDRWAVRRCE